MHNGENISKKKNIPGIGPGKLYKVKKKCLVYGKKAKKKMQNEKKEFVMQLQGKSVREFAQRLVTGKFTIEKVTLNRYKVIEGVNTPEQQYTLINRRSFVLLDKELYKLQSRQNPLAAGIEKALDADALEFTVRKSAIDKMPVKLIAKTFAYSKVSIENVLLKTDNYIIRFTLVPSVSEQDLTEKELAIAEYFIKANTAAAAGNPETEMQALPAPETVNTTATTVEVIPAK